jgi:maltooligosyltrehalose trehalohydrolase
VDRLASLRALAVRAIEVMPIATFVGQRGWGDDGLYTSGPYAPYGGPRGFAALVDAAHRADLGVIVDVVYNHLGSGSEALTAFGPYLHETETLWGRALDYGQRGVREWAIQNAELGSATTASTGSGSTRHTPSSMIGAACRTDW